MNNLKDFIIQFSGLSVGNHEFEFKVRRKFFESFDYSELEEGELDILLNFDKQETMLILEFSIKGFAKVMCDRCLGDFNYQINTGQQLIVKFGEDYQELSEDIVTIPENAYEFDIAPYVYEYINLALPIQRIHPADNDESQCEADMTEKLDDLSGEQQIDPRWEALKDLKGKIE